MPDGEMKTVLYFQSSCCENNDALLRGVVRYTRRTKRSVKVVPYAKAAACRQVDGYGSERAFRRAFAQETHSTPRQFQRGARRFDRLCEPEDT